MQRERKSVEEYWGSTQRQRWFQPWLYVQPDEKEFSHMNNNKLHMDNKDLNHLLSCKLRLSSKALVQACLSFALISHGED